MSVLLVNTSLRECHLCQYVEYSCLCVTAQHFLLCRIRTKSAIGVVGVGMISFASSMLQRITSYKLAAFYAISTICILVLLYCCVQLRNNWTWPIPRPIGVFACLILISAQLHSSPSVRLKCLVSLFTD